MNAEQAALLDHFAQGSAMRLTYVVRSVNAWFARVVYERDEWDQRLVDWSREVDLRIGIIFYLARFFVWLTRRILWLLMWLGHGISCFMLRQMEFDADRYEARVAGSQAFAETARRLHVLMAAYQGAMADLGSSWREKRLGDNLPALVMANVDQIPHHVMVKIRESVAEGETGYFDTHPSDRDRIASAEQEETPGIFHLEEPARVIFTDFDELARRASLSFYPGILDQQVSPESLVSTEELVARQKELEETREGLRRYFQDTFSPVRRLGLSAESIEPSKEPEVVAEIAQEVSQFLRDAEIPLRRFQQELNRIHNKGAARRGRRPTSRRTPRRRS